MANTLCSVSHLSAFDAKHDITWSFKYCLSGNSNTSGIFSTFLYNAPTLSFNSLSAIDGSFYQVDFNSTTNNITVNGNVVMTLPFTVKTDSELYRILRFQFTDVAQTLNIFYRSLDSNFALLTSLYVGEEIIFNYPLRVGVSYKSPIIGNKARFRLKDFHVQGKAINLFDI